MGDSGTFRKKTIFHRSEYEQQVPVQRIQCSRHSWASRCLGEALYEVSTGNGDAEVCADHLLITAKELGRDQRMIVRKL